MNIIERFNALVTLGASWVLWLLLALSAAGLFVIVERLLCFAAARDDLAKLRAELLDFMDAGDLRKARQRLQESPSFEARIAAAAVVSNGGAEDHLAAETSRARLEMERHLAFLGTIGANAPFVGLLGTVIGIIGAFRELDLSGGQLSAGLMSDIAEALVATAVGILVALPAVAAYNGFQRLIHVRLSRGEALGKDVVAAMKS